MPFTRCEVRTGVRYWENMMRHSLRFVWETGRTLLIALLIVVPLRLYVAQPFFVRGSSMEPTFSNGDYLIVDELSYRFREPKRGEVVVFRFPEDPSQFFIKRIIGLPGETVSIEDSTIVVETADGRRALREDYIRTQSQERFRIVAGPNEYVVLGDNRTASSDSRRWGVLPRDLVVGKALLTVWPPENFSVFAAPTYE